MGPTPILFCSHVVEVGGAEMVLLDLLGAMDRERFTPHLVIPGDGPLPQRAAELGVELHKVPLAGRSRLGKAWAALRSATPLRELAERIGARVLVATSMIAGYAATRAAARTPGLACVWHLHIVTRSRIAHAALHKADFVLAPSRQGLEVAGLADGALIPNGVPDRFFHASASGELRRDHGIPEDAPLLGIVGRLDPHKGHDVLLAALAQDWATDVPPHLCVAGGELFADAHARLGGYGEHLRSEATRLGLADRVHWLGELADTAPLLAELDVLVVPSTTSESAPRTIAEAQAAGCPVVASTIGGIPAMLRPEGHETGLLARPGDAAALHTSLHRALTDASWRTEAARRARQYAEAHYRMAVFAERCQAVFAQANTQAMSAMK